ncbi:MAG: hypothetical protein JWR55_1582 [Aeromicrobium sp.]|nr:hypothetical protein [Aeromicrobium sp.]
MPISRWSQRVTVVMLAALVVLAGCRAGGDPDGDGRPATASGACGDGRIVRTADELTDALATAEPGDVIVVAPGTYTGTFVADRSGQQDAPIVLCGEATSQLDAGSDEGYTLHLDGVQHWRVQGLSLQGGAKGLVLDGSSDNEIDGTIVTGTGEEGVHLRRNSSRNVVQGMTVHRTGGSKPEIGEGIYIGSAKSNWCKLTECEPDRSDDNHIIGNRVDGTTAEAIDVKEGTSGGLLRDNVLDGSDAVEADSLIDLKGNGWTVEGTVGTSSPGDGVAVFEILDGWGEDNILRDNRFDVPSDAYAVQVFGDARSNGNVVECSNAAVGATDRISNIPCSG